LHKNIQKNRCKRVTIWDTVTKTQSEQKSHVDSKRGELAILHQV